jgi:uncharacterized glyoxalase superfamily protein PhnB
MMMTHGQQSNPNVSPEWRDAILHARMNIGETELMGADVPPKRIYAVLSDGGEIFMPMEETSFAFRFGMLRHKFGTSWATNARGHRGPSTCEMRGPLFRLPTRNRARLSAPSSHRRLE